MSGLHLQDKRWWCDEIPIDLLADRYGTPLYIYSRDRIVENYQRLDQVFKPLGAHIHYSVKANSNGSILHLLKDLGAGFDVVSGGELFRTLKIGADPASIVFAGVGKTRAELEYAVENQVGWINVESVQELEVLNQLAGSNQLWTSIALRVNPSIEADTHHHIATGGHRSKFGLDLDDARSILAQPDRFPRLTIAGLHVHIGSQLASADRTIEALKKLLDLAQDHGIQMLDIGGGFPVRYQPDEAYPDPKVFADALIAELSQMQRPERNAELAKFSLKSKDTEVGTQLHPSTARPTAPLRSGRFDIIIEPGRSIIADAGALVGEVQYVKLREGRRIVVIDASMTELIRPVLYEAYHHIVAVNRSSSSTRLADIVGPVCESADVLGTDRELPEVRRGDRVLIMTAGAYGSSMASNYNSRPRPAEVMIAGSTPRLIRRRETWAELVELEE